MSEREFLQALEEDTRRKCEDIIGNARREAEAILKEAAKDMERMKNRELEKMKASVHTKKLAMLTKTRLLARETLLKERQGAAARVLDMAWNRLEGLRADRDYPDLLARLFREAMEKWRTHGTGQKAVVILSKEDVPLLKTLINAAECEMIPDETGDMAPGVIMMSGDGKYKIINTLFSRFEKARPEMITIIDRILLHP